MGSFIMLILIFFVFGSTFAFEKPSPVYHRPSAVMNASPIAAKSMSTVSATQVERDSGIVRSSLQPTSTMFSEPKAEKRESEFHGSVPESMAIPFSSEGNLEPNYRVVYLPNPPEDNNIPAEIPNDVPEQNHRISAWKKYRLDAVAVGVVSLGLVICGGALLYPHVGTVKARALRELGLDNMNSNDASRLAKSVLTAVERLYELNKDD